MNGKQAAGAGLLAVSGISILAAWYAEATGDYLTLHGDGWPLPLALLVSPWLNPLTWLALPGIWLLFRGKDKKSAAPPNSGSPSGVSEATSAKAADKPMSSVSPERPTESSPNIAPGSEVTSVHAESSTSPTSPRGSATVPIAALAVTLLVIVVAFVSYVLGQSSGSDPADTVSANSSAAVTSSSTAHSTSPTRPISTTADSLVQDPMSFDEEVGEFLLLVAAYESNDRYLQTADDSWWLWKDEYVLLAEDYRVLAEQWDRRYLSGVERDYPGLGRSLSHALLRRSDGYRLVWEATSSEAADQDIDGMLATKGNEAMDEASTLFEDVSSQLPAEWQFEEGITQSGPVEAADIGITRPDPISVRNFIVGDCYANPSVGESVSSVLRAPCRTGAMEVYWTQDIGTEFEEFPGEDSIQQFAQELCDDRAWVRFPFTMGDASREWWWTPNAETWKTGDTKVVTCVYEI